MCYFVWLENLPQSTLYNDVRLFFCNVFIQYGAIKVLGSSPVEAFVAFDNYSDFYKALKHDGGILNSQVIGVRAIGLPEMEHRFYENSRRRLDFGGQVEKRGSKCDKRRRDCKRIRPTLVVDKLLEEVNPAFRPRELAALMKEETRLRDDIREKLKIASCGKRINPTKIPEGGNWEISLEFSSDEYS